MKSSRPRRSPAPIHGSVTITFTVPREIAPALKSAIEEKSNLVGEKLEGIALFAVEDARTRAARALGVLRAAITAQVPEGDPDYV